MMRAFLVLALAATAAPVLAQPAAMPGWGAPAAGPTALYCLRMEPVTGTRIGSIMCQTRVQWIEDEIDLDKVWAEDGVRVIG